MLKNKSRLLLLSFIGLLLFCYFYFDLGSFLSLAQLQDKQALLKASYREHSFIFIMGFMLTYIVVAALSIPGAVLFTLAGGAIFGLVLGSILVSFSSTVGATGAFLMARTLFRAPIQKRYGSRIKGINEGIARDGKFYLFTLRLVPIFPFFIVNSLMGLTNFGTFPFYYISQLGMIPATIAYVNAGTQLSQIHSLRGLVSAKLLLSFAFIGVLPLVSRGLVSCFKSRKQFSARGFKKPKTYDYNLIVIGAGSAGLVSAYIASAIKAKVLLIEKHKMGGDCLNTGCVPSKALIRSAKIAYQIKNSAKFGVTSSEPVVDFAKVMDRVKKVISEIEPHDSTERYTKLGVECLAGSALIIDPYAVSVDGKKFTTKNIIIASGASPVVPNIPGLKEMPYYTSDTLWELRELPKKLLVLGGGPIGCELTQCFARFGSAVTQIEMADRIMAREDIEVSEFMTEKFKSEGIKVLTSHKATEFIKRGSDCVLICESNHKKVEIVFDAVIVALGRKANTTGLGLETLGIELTKTGTIQANEFLATNYENIYVCGDVAGPYQFTHVAAHQAWYAAVNSLFSPFKKFKVDYRVIPWATFTDPEVARVGINEQEAKAQEIEYEVTRYALNDLDRAITESEEHGFVKVITQKGNDKILGATLVGAHSGEWISEWVSAMKFNLGLNKVLGTIHIYPTFSEANKYAAGNWKRAHAPEKALQFLKKFHEWKRS